MSSVVISGDTSGAITLSAPAVAGTNTITLPASTGTVLTTGSPQSGGVLQVISTTKTDSFASSSTSFVDITGLSVSITPKFSTSKILVIYSSQVATTSGEYSSMYQIVRNSTAICIGDADGIKTRATNSNRSMSGNSDQTWVVSQNFLDSPATTSATTYKLQGLVQSGGSFVVNRSIAWTNSDTIATTTSTITVMEIAA
jgi:hypothetical protein